MLWVIKCSYSDGTKGWVAENGELTDRRENAYPYADEEVGPAMDGILTLQPYTVTIQRD